ncbi:MAG TPA: class I tRNA ligase family protein, partial [Candidatus Berkiella sp.]|nr:class I tRNA ligase family protein [Candidatus Berkiella sp.]
DKVVKQEAFEALVLMLAPMVPHISHVLWNALGHEEAVLDATWPTIDENALKRDQITMVVQVNGKMRANLSLPVDVTKEAAEQAALNHEAVIRHVEGKTIRKIITVGQKLINIVVG